MKQIKDQKNELVQSEKPIEHDHVILEKFERNDFGRMKRKARYKNSTTSKNNSTNILVQDVAEGISDVSTYKLYGIKSN